MFLRESSLLFVIKRASVTARLVALSMALVLSGESICVAQGQIKQPALPQARLGINLAAPCDWNTELPLVDVFRFSRDWISQKKGRKWGQGPQLDVDKHGWVKQLDTDCWAETPLCNIEGGHYPSGLYTVLYEGNGRIQFQNVKNIVKETPGRIVIDVDAKRGAFWLRVTAVDRSDYIRNIRVIMPGFEETATTNPWHPAFLKRWQGFACLRYMDFRHTNNSKVTTWSERPKVSDANWSHGLPIELLCDLANRTEIDPWFCMPHQANDDYIREFARLVNKRLDRKRKAYVEYSNEVWNSIFAQHKFAAARGQEAGLAEKKWEAAWRFTGLRSKQVFDIWIQEIKNRKRLVNVIAGFSINPYVTEQVLLAADAWKSADVVAIAPYFAIDINDKNANEILAGGVHELLDRVETEGLKRSFDAIHKSRQVANKYGMNLVAYEGGQHLVGLGRCSKNERLTKLLHAANEHSRMGQIYEKYYDGWARLGGDLFCCFSSVSRWNRNGSWGLLQYADDAPTQSPKFSTTIKWAKSRGQRVNTANRKR
jgi:hypothetical protein